MAEGKVKIIEKLVGESGDGNGGVVNGSSNGGGEREGSRAAMGRVLRILAG